MPCREHIVAALFLCSLAACTYRVAAPGVPKQSDERIVARVELEGADSLSASAIKSGLALRGPNGLLKIRETYFDSATVAVDKRRIETYYRNRGFLEAQVLEAKVRDLSGKRVSLAYRIDEGERTLVSAVRIEQEGGEPYEEKLLLAQVELKPGKPLLYPRYEDGQKNLVRFLAERGHAFAHARGRIFVNKGTRSAEVVYRVAAGQKVRFGSTTLHGSNRIPDSTIRDRLSYSEGEPFSPSKMLESSGALYATGLIARASFDFDREGQSEVADIDLQIMEAHRNETKVGIGFGIDNARYEARGRLEYTRRSFLLPNAVLRVEAKPRASYFRGTTSDTPLGGEVQTSLELLDLPASFFSIKATVGYAIDDFSIYSGEGPKASMSLSRPIGERVRLSASWNLQVQELSRIDDRLSEAERVSIGLVSPYRLGYFKQSLSYDDRDRPFGATRGFLLQLLTEQAGGYSVSDFSYLRATPEGRFYWTPLDGLTLASRLRVGAAHSPGGPLPVSQRYFAGGSSSHRGFAMRRLSPRGGDGRVPIGGEALIDASTELRLGPFNSSSFSYVAFLDGADARAEARDLDPSQLHWAAGLGLRYATPVGLLRVDFGYRLNGLERIVDDRWVLHLGLGESF